MKALRPCPSCERQISHDAEFCPHCGKPFRERHSVFYYVSAVVGSLLILGILAGIAYAVLVVAPERVAQERNEKVEMCKGSLKVLGLEFKTWGLDHDDLFPFNVSTNQGGTLELCNRTNGIESNPWPQFRAIDMTAQPYTGYHLHTARHGNSNPDGILAYCPEHQLVLRCDGSVHWSLGSEQEEEAAAVKFDADLQAEKERKERQDQHEDQADPAELRARAAQMELNEVKEGLERTWTYKSGQQVEGRFVRFQGAYVIVRHAEGYDENFDIKFHDFALEIQKLSDADQKILTSLVPR